MWRNSNRLLWSVQMTLPMAQRGEVKVEGRSFFFRPGEHRLIMTLLLHHPERWLSIPEITEAMWPEADAQPDYATRIIRRYVSTLRSFGMPISTRRGYGYRIGPENRASYSSRRIISKHNPNCVNEKRSRMNRKSAGDYHNSERREIEIEPQEWIGQTPYKVTK